MRKHLGSTVIALGMVISQAWAAPGGSESVPAPAPTPSVSPTQSSAPPAAGARETPKPLPVGLTVKIIAKTPIQESGSAVFEWEATPRKIEFQMSNEGGQPTPKARIKVSGLLFRKNWSVAYASKAVSTKRSTKSKKEAEGFQFTVELKSVDDELEVVAINPKGQIFTERLSLEWRDEDRDRVRELIGTEAPRKWSFGALVGFSYIMFDQPGILQANQLGLVIKATANFRPKPKGLEYGANAYYSGIKLSTSPAGSPALGFLGANLRAGYAFPLKSDILTLTFSTGIFYGTTLSSTVGVGYQTLLSWQLYPVLRWRATPQSQWIFAAKYVPLDNSFFKLQLRNRELSFSLQYLRIPKKAMPWIVALDYSTLHIEPSTTTDISVGSISLSGGVQF